MIDNQVDVKGWSDFAVSIDLKKNHIKAIEALLSTQTITDAAKQTGISERTLHRWMRNSDFQQGLRYAMRELASDMLRRLVAGREDALDAMHDLLLNAKHESVKRIAAKDWLDMLVQTLEIQEIEQRLTQLEIQVNA